MPKPKVDMRCPDCGEGIWTECFMYWDVKDQCWNPTEEPNGLFSCIDCTYETKFIDNVRQEVKP